MSGHGEERDFGSLWSLSLADAGVGAAGAKALGDALPANESLVALRLDRNALIKQYQPLVRRLAHHMMAKLPAVNKLSSRQ